MNKSSQVQIDRAKELLRAVRHAAMATVNADGTPHNTPFFLILDPELKRVYFGSHPSSLHSQNVVRTGELFVVVYDAIERGGLFMKAIHGKELAGSQLDEALKAHNATRAREDKPPLTKDYYSGENPQRMYGADLVTFWVNDVERGNDGLVIRDYRVAVQREMLL